jgi:hypothetical protein
LDVHDLFTYYIADVAMRTFQGQEDRFGGSYSVVYSALVEEGAIGLIGYGMLTAVQIVPGFLSFIASK